MDLILTQEEKNLLNRVFNNAQILGAESFIFASMFAKLDKMIASSEKPELKILEK